MLSGVMHFSGPVPRAAMAGFAVLAAVVAGPTRPLGAAPLAAVAVEGGGLELRTGTAPPLRVVPETPSLRRGIPLVREQAIEGHSLAELRIPVRGSARVETWIVDLGSKPPRVLWNGFTGPRDSDEEVAVHVELTADGIVEYQTAAQVSRCDGQPARLFPRVWDFASGRFRPVLSPLPAPASQSIVARRGDPRAPVGRSVSGFQWVAASTTAAEGRDARGLTAPSALNDGNAATAWAEGLGGDGRGEFLTARGPAGAAGIQGVRIVPGDASSAAAFRARNRLRRFQLIMGAQADQRFDVEIPEDPQSAPRSESEPWRRAYWVALPRPVASSCVTVVIADVYHGSEAAPPRTFGTTAIAEMEIFTDLDQPGGTAHLVGEIAQMADGPAADCAARVPLLVSLGEPAIAPVVQALPTAKGPARSCLIEALTRLSPAPKAEPVVGALLSALSGATEREEASLRTALLRAEPPPVAALEKRLSSESEPVADRARTARLLGAFDSPAATGALLAAAGRGPDDVRAAVVAALAGSPALTAETFWAALSLEKRDVAPGVTIDLLRVLPSFLRRHPEAGARALPMLRGALAADRPFEVRGRAILAIGSLRTDDSVAALAQVRGTSDEPALRLLAARELAADPSVAATTGLRQALSDGDPSVRETAAQGLGERKDRAAGEQLIAGAKQERWPEVRRAELAALGRLCFPAGNDLMIRAVARDFSEVRRASLVGLAACRDARARTVLLRTLVRRDEAAAVRALAATLLADLGDKTASPALAIALRQLVSEAEADLALEVAAAATLRALARLGGAEAVSAAAGLATDPHHPYQATAIEALGTLCDPRVGAATLRKLATATATAGPEVRLSDAAQAAEKACATGAPRAP
ncbi:MAG TPA: HEAT repeat domain-containing protein, partial [Polyangia bacterium]|nr:HEAT repeat domain-containing protein [Polyangia bacterium]